MSAPNISEFLGRLKDRRLSLGESATSSAIGAVAAALAGTGIGAAIGSKRDKKGRRRIKKGMLWGALIGALSGGLAGPALAQYMKYVAHENGKGSGGSSRDGSGEERGSAQVKGLKGNVSPSAQNERPAKAVKQESKGVPVALQGAKRESVGKPVQKPESRIIPAKNVPKAVKAPPVPAKVESKATVRRAMPSAAKSKPVANRVVARTAAKPAPYDFEREAISVLRPWRNAFTKKVYYAPGVVETRGEDGSVRREDALVDLSSPIARDFHKVLKDVRANPGRYSESSRRNIIKDLRDKVDEIRKREKMDDRTRLFIDFNKDENGRPILEGGPDDVMPRNGSMYEANDIEVLPEGMRDYASRLVKMLKEVDEKHPENKVDAPKVSNADMVLNAIMRADRRYQGKYMPVDSLKGAYRFGGRMKHLDPNLVGAGMDSVYSHADSEGKLRKLRIGEPFYDAGRSFLAWKNLIDSATPIEKTRMILKLWNANRALGDRFIHGLKKMDREYSGFLKAPKDKNPGYDVAVSEKDRYNKLLDEIKRGGREGRMYWPDWYVENPLLK